MPVPGIAHGGYFPEITMQTHTHTLNNIMVDKKAITNILMSHLPQSPPPPPPLHLSPVSHSVLTFMPGPTPS